MKIKPMLGEFTLDDIEHIQSSESRALVEHRVPGLAGSYFQDMGSVPNTITIRGAKAGDDTRDAFLTGIRDLFNKGEPTTFVADINTATDITQVVIENLDVEEIGGVPDSFRYMVTLRKYVEPPEPPATGLLDEGILDDALSLVDGAMNAIDMLESVQNVGDPTGPLSGAMDGVSSAVADLPAVVDELKELTGGGESGNGPLNNLPSQDQFSGMLGGIVGNGEQGTGVAGVAKLLGNIDIEAMTSTMTRKLDGTLSVSVSGNAGASVTGNVLTEFDRVAKLIPADPEALIAPLKDKLEAIKKLSAEELVKQLLEGTAGLQEIQSLIPVDTSALLQDVVPAIDAFKKEMISGEFAELREWSTSVQTLYEEINQAIAKGTGSVEERLIAFLTEKIQGVVKAAIPGGPVMDSLMKQIDRALTAEKVSAIMTLKAALIADVEKADAEIRLGNVTNTIFLASAESKFSELVDALAAIVEAIRTVLSMHVTTPGGLAQEYEIRIATFEQVKVIDLGNIKDKFAAAIAKLEAAIGKINLEAAGKKVIEAFDLINGKIDQVNPRKLTEKLGDVQKTIDDVVAAVDGVLLQVVASIRNALRKVREALENILSVLGSFDEQHRFHFRVEQDIRDFLGGIKSTLRDTIQPMLEEFRTTIGGLLTQVQDLLKAVQGQIDTVKQQLQDTLSKAGDQLEQVDIPGQLQAVGQKLQGMLDELGRVDFDVVVNPVVEGINDLRDMLKKVNLSAMGELAVGAFKVSVKVILEIKFTAQITKVLMAKINELLAVPKNAVGEIGTQVESGLQRLTVLAPDVVLSPLDEVFKPVQVQLDALKLARLQEPLDAWYGRINAEVQKVSPAALLAPIIDVYEQLHKGTEAIALEKLIAPLQEAMEAVKQELQRIDVTGVAEELSQVVQSVRTALDRVSPERLVDPLVNVFGKILQALDAFDAGVLLKPFDDVFGKLTAPLENLVAGHVALIQKAFSPLIELPKVFDPQHAFTAVGGRLRELDQLVQQLNIGSLMADLRQSHANLQAALQVAGPGGSSLSVRVTAMNPLQHDKLGEVATGFQEITAKLQGAFAQPSPPEALTKRYEAVKAKLESLVPAWAKGDMTPESIRRAFKLANPLSLRDEINHLWAAIKNKLKTLDPALIKEQVKATYERAKQALLVLDPTLLVQDIQNIINRVIDKLTSLDLSVVTTELSGMVGDIRSVITALDPGPIIEQLNEVMAEVTAALEAFKPAELLKPLQEPFDQAKSIVMAFDPSELKKPLMTIFERIQTIVAAIDIGVVTQPLVKKLDELRDDLAAALKKTEVAFDGMIAAVPSGAKS